jgi:hypothetical protein
MARAIVESSSSVVNEVATGEANEKSEASNSSHNGFGPLWHLFKTPTVKIWKCLMIFSKNELGVYNNIW